MPPLCHSERQRGNLGVSRTHQASDIAKLWQEFLSLLELIACIGCAVVVARTNAVYDDKQVCCHHRDDVRATGCAVSRAINLAWLRQYARVRVAVATATVFAINHPRLARVFRRRGRRGNHLFPARPSNCRWGRSASAYFRAWSSCCERAGVDTFFFFLFSY